MSAPEARQALLVTHTGRRHNSAHARTVAADLIAAGFTVRVIAEEAPELDLPGVVPVRGIAAAEGAEIVFALGGDGTFLRAAELARPAKVPLIGINLGKVGFLSKAEASDLEPVLEKISAGDFTIDERLAIEGRILRQGVGDDAARHVALNDIVIARGSLARVCRFDVSIDDSHLATFIADGLVVASPTGSTGYSFSAGGPILDPESRNLVVTPIAAYLSAIRSVVVSPQQVVRCRVVDAFEALVSVDGREDLPIAVGDVVEVRAMDRPIRLIEPKGAQPFWDLLRHKVELLPS